MPSKPCWDAVTCIAWLAAVALVVGVNYSMALLGHPVALWFWRDVLGVISG